MRPLLDNPNEPINDLSYYDCLDSVTDKSKVSTLIPLLYIVSILLFTLLIDFITVVFYIFF